MALQQESDMSRAEGEAVQTHQGTGLRTVGFATTTRGLLEHVIGFEEQPKCEAGRRQTALKQAVTLLMADRWPLLQRRCTNTTQASVRRMCFGCAASLALSLTAGLRCSSPTQPNRCRGP